MSVLRKMNFFIFYWNLKKEQGFIWKCKKKNVNFIDFYNPKDCCCRTIAECILFHLQPKKSFSSSSFAKRVQNWQKSKSGFFSTTRFLLHAFYGQSWQRWGLFPLWFFLLWSLAGLLGLVPWLEPCPWLEPSNGVIFKWSSMHSKQEKNLRNVDFHFGCQFWTDPFRKV